MYDQKIIVHGQHCTRVVTSNTQKGHVCWGRNNMYVLMCMCVEYLLAV